MSSNSDSNSGCFFIMLIPIIFGIISGISISQNNTTTPVYNSNNYIQPTPSYQSHHTLQELFPEQRKNDTDFDLEEILKSISEIQIDPEFVKAINNNELYKKTRNKSVFSPSDAYDEGYDAGYEQGYEDGSRGKSYGYYYDDSCSYDGSYEDEYEEGYDSGYSDGFYAGQNEYEESEEEED